MTFLHVDFTRNISFASQSEIHVYKWRFLNRIVLAYVFVIGLMHGPTQLIDGNSAYCLRLMRSTLVSDSDGVDPTSSAALGPVAGIELRTLD